MTVDGSGLDALTASTQRLLVTLEGLSDAAARGASHLPGWTVGHVLTHLARNADGNRRMAEGAARGESLDQYPHGPDGRAADIEAGAGRSAGALIADVRESAAALADALASMPARGWDVMVRPLSGAHPASVLPAARRREVEIHHADLGLVYGPPDWPADLVAQELGRAAAGLPGRLPAGTALRVLATDTGWAAEVGDGPASLSVSAPSHWLLAWLIGRPVRPTALNAPAGLPPLGPW